MVLCWQGALQHPSPVPNSWGHSTLSWALSERCGLFRAEPASAKIEERSICKLSNGADITKSFFVHVSERHPYVNVNFASLRQLVAYSLVVFLILTQRLYLIPHFSLRPSEGIWLSQSRGLRIKIVFIFLIHTYYWSIDDLQCFRCTARWFSYTNTHRLFLKLFSIIGYYKILTMVPYAVQ